MFFSGRGKEKNTKVCIFLLRTIQRPEIASNPRQKCKGSDEAQLFHVVQQRYELKYFSSTSTFCVVACYCYIYLSTARDPCLTYQHAGSKLGTVSFSRGTSDSVLVSFYVPCIHSAMTLNEGTYAAYFSNITAMKCVSATGGTEI